MGRIAIASNGLVERKATGPVRECDRKCGRQRDGAGGWKRPLGLCAGPVMGRAVLAEADREHLVAERRGVRDGGTVPTTEVPAGSVRFFVAVGEA